MKIWRTSRVVLCVLAVFAMTAPSFAQAKWSVPQLQELGPRDQVRSGKAALSPAEKAALRDITGRAIRACLRDPGLEDPTTFGSYLESLTVKRVFLNEAGLHGLIVQGWGDCMCGATGNCDFWLIAEKPSGFDVVLQTIGIQSFQIQKTVSNGYFDVILGRHDSATWAFTTTRGATTGERRARSCLTMGRIGAC